MMLIPLLRAVGYALIPAAYWGIGWLNYNQAGKNALLGSMAILALSSWTLRSAGGEGRKGRAGVIIAAVLFLIIAALQAYIRDVYGVGQDDFVVTEAVFNTTSSEASQFFLQSIPYVLKHLAIAAVCLLFFYVVVRKSSRVRPQNAVGIFRRTAPLQLTLLFLLLHLNPSLREDDPLLYVPVRYAAWKTKVDAARHLQAELARVDSDSGLSTLAYTGKGPRTVVLVLGESTTRLDWSLYGYQRNTTPELQQMAHELLRFDDVVSSDSSTIPSVEKMLTLATLTQPELWTTKPDVITAARRAGYRTFWLSNQENQSTSRGVVGIFASHADVKVWTNKGSARGEGSFDEELLVPLEKALLDPAPLKFIVVHLLGAHPAYNFRYPASFQRFGGADDEVARELKKSGRAFWAIILRNHYDNAMLYGDHILRETIDLCREKSSVPTCWLYLSDHGQEVAHYSNFCGHATKTRSMYEVPMLFWHSDDFGLPAVSPADLVKRPYQLDYLDHTLFGLMGITGDYYDARHDVFSPMYSPEPRTIAGKPYQLETRQMTEP